MGRLGTTGGLIVFGSSTSQVPQLGHIERRPIVLLARVDERVTSVSPLTVYCSSSMRLSFASDMISCGGAGKDRKYMDIVVADAN